jgi:hypothetical protein
MSGRVGSLKLITAELFVVSVGDGTEVKSLCWLVSAITTTIQ